MPLNEISHQSSSNYSQEQGSQARAQRDNHHLPFRSGVATPGQLAATEQAISILLRSLEELYVSDEMVRAGLTVRLMLDLGRDAVQLAGLKRMHLDTNDLNPPDRWGLISWACSGATKYGWWLPAGVHVESKAANRDVARGEIWLPVLDRTKPWLAIAGLMQDLGPRPLIAETSAAVKRDVSCFFAWAKTTLGPLGHSLPRADRLAGSLTEIMAWQPTGDRTLANQVSGQDMEHSVSRGYYTSLSTPTAAKVYAKAMPSTVSEISLVAGSGKIEMPAFAKTALTRKNPKGSPELMRSMLGRLSNKPDGRQKRFEIIQSHKHLVIRLWIVLALSTGSRSLIKSLPGLERIEPRTGGMVVLDKDRKGDDNPHPNNGKTLGSTLGRARLVFLHPTVREILVVYITHLKKLARRADLDADSKNVITEHVEALETDKLMPFLELKRHTDKKTLFVKPVQSGWIEAEFKDLADVRANFARHTLRSGLIGHTPQSAVDALLGHFDRGTEPWSNGSAFDPSAYRALLRAIFEAHFKEDGDFKKGPPKPDE